MRWIRPPELDRGRVRDRFDPLVEGARHGLSHEVSLAIWERARRDATGADGRHDAEAARLRFHEVAAHIAARGGRLRPDVGRLTRVGVELEAGEARMAPADELAMRAPGRDTRVAAEARQVTQPARAATLEATPALAAASPAMHRTAPAAAVFRREAEGIRDLDDPIVEEAVNRQGGGAPLRESLRRLLEAQLGVRFDRVRIHTDAIADQAAKAIGARAFTIGEDIYFAEGAFTSDAAGLRLLAHELTHVVQHYQGRIATAAGITVSRPGDPLEREAEATAAHVTSAPEPVGAARAASTPEPAAAAASHRLAAPPHDLATAAARPSGARAIHRAPPEGDEFNAWDKPGWGFWLIQLQKEQPTFADIRAAVIATGRVQAGDLDASAVRQIRPGGLSPYWLWRHPSKGVVARASTMDRASSDDLAGIYLFVDEATIKASEKGSGSLLGTSGAVPGSKGADGRIVGGAERDARFTKLPEKERVAINAAANQLFWDKTSYKKGQPLGNSKEDQAQAKVWMQIRDDLLIDREKIMGLPADVRDVLVGKGGSVKPEDYKRALRIADKLLKLDPKDRALIKLQGATESMESLELTLETGIDSGELKRLFEVMQSKVKDQQFSDKGDSWVKWAKFLDQNKDKIEGILQGKPPGKLTQEKIEKVIAEYDKFIAAEPVEDTPDKLETVEDFDKKFKYDPGWQKLSKEDRKLLLDYAKLNPDEITEGKVDFARVTTDMKVAIALKLSYKSWPGATAEAAKTAFTDPSFVIMLVVIIAIYVGLWLVPEPTMVTKIAAGTLTAVLLAQFAWEDIYGLAKAWMTLQEDCAAGKTVAELQKAGDKFAKKVGQVGFDILMFIAMWGLGKAAGPKISKIGNARATARAEAKVTALEGEPGSGVAKPATGEAAKLVETAKTKAGGEKATDAGVLDALADLLPDGARKGLADFRAKLGDAGARKALESRAAKGEDISHFLGEQGMTPEARAQVRAKLVDARIQLARAKLIELGVNKDPALRRALDQEAKKLGDKLKAEKDPARQQQISDGYNVNELVGELAEALARVQLQAEFPGKQIIANVELVREVAGYKTIAEWKAAQPDPAKADIGGLYEANGKLWKSITEVDAMVVEPGKAGKLRPIEMEQVKSGKADSQAAAQGQNAKAKAALKEIADGAADVQIFDRTGKNTLGKQRTGEFDLSGIDGVSGKTRGLPGKGFDKSLDFGGDTLNGPEGRGILEGLARLLLQDGLANHWTPPTAVPPTSAKPDAGHY